MFLSAHNITEQVEQQLERVFGPARVTIHVEPHSYVEREISYGIAEGDYEGQQGHSDAHYDAHHESHHA